MLVVLPCEHRHVLGPQCPPCGRREGEVGTGDCSPRKGQGGWKGRLKVLSPTPDSSSPQLYPKRHPWMATKS